MNELLKVVHVGLGDFGIGWCKAVYERKDLELVGVVDSRKSTHRHVEALNVPCYLSLAEALETVKPDFIVNATPPGAHMEINKLAFSYNIPVLMEKPISEDFAEVMEMLKMSEDGQKLVVAENYRYSARNIFVKEQLRKHLHGITGINLLFRKHHHVSEGNYHAQLKHPAIIDIGVHHIDLLRFFTGRDVRKVSALLYTPTWSWYSGFSNAKMLAEMDDGMHFCYDCSLDSHRITSWGGEWTFSAENGTGFYDGEKLVFNIGGEIIEPEMSMGLEKPARQMLLDEFILYVKDGIIPQTDITDQVKNAAVAEAAIRSSADGCLVDVDTLLRRV